MTDSSPSPPAGQSPGPLSPRETEVLKLVARGYSNRKIAVELLLAEPTIATHIRHILAKSRTANRAEAAAWAIRTGWNRTRYSDPEAQLDRVAAVAGEGHYFVRFAGGAGDFEGHRRARVAQAFAGAEDHDLGPDPFSRDIEDADRP